MRYRALFWLIVPAMTVLVSWLLTKPDPAQPLFSVPEWGSMSLPEALWLLSGIVAYVSTVRHLPDLLFDYRVVRESGSETLPLTAWGYFVRELLRMLSSIGTIVVGLFASLEADPRPGPTQISIVGVVLTIVLVGQSALVSGISIFDWRQRHKLEVLIAAGKNGYHTTTEGKGDVL